MHKPFAHQPALLLFLLFYGIQLSAQVRFTNYFPNPFPQLEASTTANQFFAGDFDSDGDVDLVFWNGTLDQYYENKGNGSFTWISNNAQTPFSGIRMPVFGLQNTVMLDFDSDGDLDILYFDTIRNFHIYLQNTGSAFIQGSNPFANFIGGNDPAKATVNQFFPGDFDNDGDIDMLYSTGSMAKYYKSNGNGTFTHFDELSNSPFASIPAEALPVKGWHNAVKADFDSDGDIDIYAFNPNTGLHYYLQNNAGSFRVATNPFPNVIDNINPPVGTTNRFQAGDFDTDGDVDLVFWTPAVNQYYRNNGNGSFTFFPNYMNTPFEGVNGPSYGLDQSQITDLDNDGDIDLISNEGPVYSFLFQNGTPPFVQQFDPKQGAKNVPLNANIVMQFSTPVTMGSGNIYILKTGYGSIAETIPVSASAVTGFGTNTITIDPVSNFQGSMQYSILFDQTAIKDVDGRIFGNLQLEWRRSAAIGSSRYYSFTTMAAPPSGTNLPTDPIIKFAAYPNPVQAGKELVIVSPFNQGTIRFMDATGRIHKQLNWKTGDVVSTSGLAAGIYILECSAASNLEHIRIFVN